MALKRFKVGFYVGCFAKDDGEYTNVSEVFELMHNTMEENDTYFPSLDKGNDVYQVRDLIKPIGGSTYKGYFAKFRKNDLPHIATQNRREESEIDLDEAEGLIEKNYFLFDARYQLLVFQVNSSGLTINAISELITEVSKQTLVFNPVLTKDAAERVINNQHKTKKYELGFTVPQNPDLYPADNWSSNLFSMLNGQGGASCTITVNANPIGRKDGRLIDGVKGWLTQFTNSDIPVRLSKIWFDDGTDPIDLVADRIKAQTQPIEMEGRYPSAIDLYSELARCKNERDEEIRLVLADG